MVTDATQYLLPERAGFDTVEALLADHFELVAGRVEPNERTFYDTFDGRLHAAGLALVGQAGRLVAASGPSYRELAAAPTISANPPERMLATELPAGPLRDLLEPILEVRALQPIARTRGLTMGLRLLNRDTKTVVRLVLEAATALGRADRTDVPLRLRLHVIGVRGYNRALARVRRTLEERLGLEASSVPLHDEAVRLGGKAPGGIQTKLDLRLAADVPARVGAAIALVEMLRTIELTLPGVLADVDTEFLHDLRVGVRRTRSVQRQLAPVFPVDRLRWFRGEFRWLGQITGPTRDLDVLLLDFDRLRADMPAGRVAELGPMGDLLRLRRERERKQMAAALASERTRRMLADWETFLAGLGGAPAGHLPVDRPLGELVGRRIRNVYRHMRRAGAAIEEETPAERLHDLRKQGKELRYLLEIFASLYPAEAVQSTVRTLKALQEILGQFQDREVQATTLRSLGGELAVLEGGPAALIALGVVLERIESESSAARAEFAERFQMFAAADQNAVVREVFG